MPKTKLPTTLQANRLDNGQLRVQVGCRIRLSNEDRETLKAAYKAAAHEEMNTKSSPTNSYVSVSTMYNTPLLNRALGMDSMLFTQIVASRDALAMGLLLRFQKVLGVEIVDRAFLHSVFDSYLEHIGSQHCEPTD